MIGSSNRTYTLDPEHLRRAIEVLKRAGESFGLTRRERIGYRALIISGDLIIVGVVWSMISSFFFSSDSPTIAGLSEVSLVLCASILILSTVGGIVSLLLNVPVFRKTWHERAELEKLGLTKLSKSLWMVERKHRWLPRVRGALLLLTGASFLFGAFFTPFALLYEELFGRLGGSIALVVMVAVLYALLGFTMLGARYLRNRREQIELVANVGKLEESLRELRLSAGDGAAIKIPAEILHQVARIESSQITQERKAAILGRVGSERSGYSVLFAREAAEQKSALDRAARIELEELVEQLSTGMLHGEADVRGAGEVNRSRTASASVEIEYATDEPRRAIRVVAVRRIGDDADRTPGPEEQGHA